MSLHLQKFIERIRGHDARGARDFIIENLLPFEEVFLGSNHKSYKHKYFLAYTHKINDNILQNYQQSEVSKIEWKTLAECLDSIRPYNLEKKQLIININKVLEEYRLY
jgi:hypothetical protein